MIDDVAEDRAPFEEALRRHYAGRRVLVTGADAFLGFNCAVVLQSLGAIVSVISRREAPRVGRVTGQVFRGDMRDGAFVRAAVNGQETVLDFAGTTGALDSNEAPVDNVVVEILPHLNLFRACAESAPQPVVFFCSSRLVYGAPEYLPVDEKHPLNPASIYAAHKIAAENYLRVFGHTHGLRWCVARLSNPYGPHDEVRGKRYGIINRFIHLAMQGQPITVYGDGHQLRDYIYVEDALRAILAVAASEECWGHVFNLGSSAGIRLCDAVDAIARVAGGTPVQFVPWPTESRRVETGDYRSDLRKLHAAVSLPREVSFLEGLRRTMKFHAEDGVRNQVS